MVEGETSPITVESACTGPYFSPGNEKTGLVPLTEKTKRKQHIMPGIFPGFCNGKNMAAREEKKICVEQKKSVRNASAAPVKTGINVI
jgi:hypothetical protein